MNLETLYDEPDGPYAEYFIEHEAQLNNGDSGGPMFAKNENDHLTIVGINWYHRSDKTISGVSYVGDYATDILNFIEANPIPEAETIFMLLSLGSILFAYRLKSR